SSMDDLSTNKRRTEEALSLYRKLGNARGIALQQWALGTIAIAEEDPTRAQQILEESVATLRELGDEQYVLHVTRTLAWTHELLGDLDQARALHEENLGRARLLGNQYAMANTLGSLAAIAVEQGRIHDAMALL